VSLVQTANIAGNTIAGILTGLVLLHYLGTADSLRLIGFLGLLFALVLAWESFRTPGWASRVASGLMATGLLVTSIGFPNARTFWANLYQTDPDGFFMSAEDSSGVVVLRPNDDRSRIELINGRRVEGVYPFGLPYSMLGLLPTLLHPNPESAMTIGLGSGATPYMTGLNPQTEHILVVELVSAEFSLLDELIQTETGQPVNVLFQDQRYEFVVGDGRRELAFVEGRFDIIEAGGIHAWASGSGYLYSREYYEQVREKLADGGIAGQLRIEGSQRVETTFTRVFPYVVEVDDRFLLGSESPIEYDQELLLTRLEDPQVANYIEASGADLEAIRDFISDATVTVWTPDTPRTNQDINTDLHPKDEYFLNNRSTSD
jgi:predicted membrane-bound spermidine synthase